MVNRSTFQSSADAGPGGAGQSGGNIISMVEVTAALRRWWWQCMLAGLVCGSVAGAAVWATFTPVYEALGLLLIKSDPDYIAFKEQVNSNSFAWTQLETLRSPIVLSRVASKPEIANQKEAKSYGGVDQWLVKKLDVRFVGHSDLCQITFRSDSPQVAAMIVNAIADEYLALHQDNQSEQTERIINLLVAQQRERQSEVEALRENVRAMTKRTTGHEPVMIHGSNNNSMVMTRNPLAEIEQRRVAAEVEYNVCMAQLKAYQDAAAENKVEVPPELLQRALFEEPEIQTLASTYAMLEQELSQTRHKARPGRNDLVAVKEKEVQLKKKALDAAVERLRPAVTASVERELLADQVDKINDLKYKVEIQKRLLAQWEERMDKERKEMESHGDERLSLQFAQDDLERSEEVHSRIAERIVALKTEKLAPARASKQHAAKVPLEPVEKIPYAKLGVAGGGAFFLPFGVAFLFERLTRRVSDSSRLAADTNVAVLGEIAMLPTRHTSGKTPSTTYFRERVTFEESVDALRVTLMHLPESKNIATLLVTSAVSGEGKTNLATSLAISLARATHEPLLIIDGDMRDPDVHEIFGAPLRPGLANVLDNSSTLNDAIFKTEVENVDLLPAGRLKYSPHFLLRNGAFEAILDNAKRRYRYVIIDSPPVLSASESVVLANACDGVVVCTRCDYSRSPQLCTAKEKLQNAGARVLGAVISGVPTRSWAQRYGGYGYGWERYAEAYHSFYSPRQNLLEQQEELPSDQAIDANGHG
jgi:succinoglycan biosynthesis transport protein ExoP